MSNPIKIFVRNNIWHIHIEWNLNVSNYCFYNCWHKSKRKTSRPSIFENGLECSVCYVYFSQGGYSGDAAGFKLGSLMKLTEIRANKPRMNLMHYVAMVSRKQDIYKPYPVKLVWRCLVVLHQVKSAIMQHFHILNLILWLVIGIIHEKLYYPRVPSAYHSSCIMNWSFCNWWILVWLISASVFLCSLFRSKFHCYIQYLSLQRTFIVCLASVVMISLQKFVSLLIQISLYGPYMFTQGV